MAGLDNSSSIHRHHQQEGHAHFPTKDPSLGDMWPRAKAARSDPALKLLGQQRQPGDQARVDQRSKDGSQDLHDHVQQGLPPLHVPRAQQGKADGRVEVGAGDVGKGVDCRQQRTEGEGGWVGREGAGEMTGREGMNQQGETTETGTVHMLCAWRELAAGAVQASILTGGGKRAMLMLLVLLVPPLLLLLSTMAVHHSPPTRPF
jgi:hypothetical protein